MCRKLSRIALVLVVSLVTMATVYGNDVIWDFENGNDHGFSLWSVKYATPAPDDPNTAGDESLTGVGGADGLPDAGVAWSIGPPNQFDGLKPAVDEGNHRDSNGLLDWTLNGHPISSGTDFDNVNERGQSSYLNTYNLNQWGDGLHSASNDQIATSPIVVLGENAVLTVWSHGGGNGTHAPEFDPNPDDIYSDGSSGIAVISATDFSFLASVYTQNKGTLGENTLDLSAFAGQKVLIEVVDAFEGSWGWLAVDEIQIINATVKNAALIVQMTDGVMDWGFDAAMKEHLEVVHGYNVRVIDGQSEISDGDFTIDDANAMDLLVISESISSSRSDPLMGTTTPTMHQEAYGWDNHNFAGAAVATNWYEGTDVDIVNDSHPIIVDANLSMGPMKFFDPANSWTAELASNLAPGAEVLAQINVGGDELAIVFAIEKGAELANGDPAASRIVGFSLPGLGTDNGGPFGPEAMTDEAWAFFDAAIRWLDVPPPPTAAMIVNPDDLSSGFDQVQYDRLVSMGYEVTIVPQSDVGSAFTIADAERFDLLLVSESISSSGADPLIGANVPMMHNESYGWDNHDFIVPELKGATWVGGSSIDVVNDAHPIAVDAGLSAGSLQFYNTDASWTADLVSALAPGAELIAQTTVVDGNNVTDYALIFAIEQGAELAGGATAANRIVGFSIPADQPYDADVMTEEAWALWEAAVNWLDTPATPVAPVTPTPAPPGTPAQMVAHWPMDDGAGTTVTDVVGGNNGTMVGLDSAAAWIADGALGGAVSFDNIDGHHIEVPHSDALDFGDVNFSISMMVCYQTPPVDTDRWIIKGTHDDPGTGSRYELFHTSGGTVRWTIDNGPANIKSRVEVSNAAFVTGDWVHVVAIRDAVNDQLSIYADGVLQGTGTDSSGDISSGETLWIGESTDETETAMSGDIDDIRIFDNVLTEDEIVALY